MAAIKPGSYTDCRQKSIVVTPFCVKKILNRHTGKPADPKSSVFCVSSHLQDFLTLTLKFGKITHVKVPPSSHSGHRLWVQFHWPFPVGYDNYNGEIAHVTLASVAVPEDKLVTFYPTSCYRVFCKNLVHDLQYSNCEKLHVAETSGKFSNCSTIIFEKVLYAYPCYTLVFSIFYLSLIVICLSGIHFILVS